MTNTKSPLVTVVISPRERFSLTEGTLASVIQDTSVPFDLLVVDGGYPIRLKRRLESMARARGFLILRKDYYLSPNEARNLALPHVATKYVAFIDNDLVVVKGWLEALVRCAEDTGADIVSPVVCIGEPLHSIIHIAGGTVRIVEKNGKRALREVHQHANRQLDEVRDELRRERTELAEFHCMLVRRKVFDRLGPLDESLKATSEHIDLCMKVRNAGGAVFLEPSAVVTYLPAPPLAMSDVPYYLLRWGDEWCIASERHLAETWGVAISESAVLSWTPRHRRRAYPRIVRAAQQLLGWNRSRTLLARLESAVAKHAHTKREQARKQKAALD
jgi:hypothetical protein